MADRKLAPERAIFIIFLLFTCAVHPSQGGCEFPASWTGAWFQSGMQSLVTINATSIAGKGDCIETESTDKFLLYERSEDCYRCLVIHEKHPTVLQYKETYCDQKRGSVSTICDGISGDAPLFSMFRKYPAPKPQPCPFKQAPFAFTYSRGSGECSNPPSKAESCTDDSRLVLRYQACPDVPGTEANVEELVCLATWKEGSTRYLVGEIRQPQRRNTILSDEDLYRCFVYKGSVVNGRRTYVIAQSGDAGCSALTSPTDGSKTITLTDSEDHHKKCHFPTWITDHHKWFSLDHSYEYHFTQRNATLKIRREDGTGDELRLVCHSILMQQDKRRVQLVAHVTRGCESGHVCVTFERRVGGVLEVQQGRDLAPGAEDACAHASTSAQPPYITLISTTLHPSRCPMFGRYVVSPGHQSKRRRRDQAGAEGGEGGGGGGSGGGGGGPATCAHGEEYESLQVGCGVAQDTMEFKSPCSSAVYTCHGHWTEGGTGYLVAAPVARSSREPAGAYCFIYQHTPANETREGGADRVYLSRVARSCDRSAAPSPSPAPAAPPAHHTYTLLLNGTCAQSSMYSGGGHLVAGTWLALAAVPLALARS